MRVAIVCGAGIVSGKEIMSLELGEGLRAAGCEIHFITSRWGSGEFARRARASGFPVSRMWIGFIAATLRLGPMWMTADQLRRAPALWLGYRRFLHTFQPDRVVHTNWHHVLMLWPFLQRGRDIYWAHEVMRDTPQYRRLFQRMARRIGAFVGVSHATSAALKLLGIPAASVYTIHNGVSDLKVETRTIASPAPRIGIVGQVGEWKGHEDLLHAFQLVREKHETAELHIFGEGECDFVQELQELALTLGVEKGIFWHGFVRDLQTIYAEVEIVAVPSRVDEPFGMTALEAALHRLPVVATRRGGLCEVVEDGETGFLVEPSNLTELAGRLTQLIENGDLRRLMGEKARKRALVKFGQDQFVQQFVELIRLPA